MTSCAERSRLTRSQLLKMQMACCAIYYAKLTQMEMARLIMLVRYCVIPFPCELFSVSLKSPANGSPPFCLFTEFQAFINHTESGLWRMFQSIDRNQNGEIDKSELRNAFAQSGVTVSNSRLDQFFAEVDKNNDGVISYAEWRFDLPDPSDQIIVYSVTVNVCWILLSESGLTIIHFLGIFCSSSRSIHRPISTQSYHTIQLRAI